ncbi:MAG: UDP-N-acetylmuramoyl-L-alanyl-D-glutamate--2,6-diaminopimelate ligase [Rhodospirillales bacterium]|nr:MAG: UDP-N-acetylmuramoyl-L-alanyl-D-glutamate--2,6-diaminopimelate ligase [Rhodospirillales bacterium]
MHRNCADCNWIFRWRGAGLRLIELIGESAYRTAQAAGGIPPDLGGGPDISALTADSREVQPGALFAALPGSVHDGRKFISQAVAAGAAAVLAPSDIRPDSVRPAVLIAEDNPRRQLALAAAAFFGTQPGTVVAVTGTNGKTSVATFLQQIWTHLGLRAASMGTLGVSSGNERLDSGPALTTADPIVLHRTLCDLAKAGIDFLAMEASSHGLDQHRLDGVRLSAGALTNISRDHLDYHGGIEAYRKAKLRLFENLLPEGAAAVACHETPDQERVAATAVRRRLNFMTYGIEAGDVYCPEAAIAGTGWRLTVSVAGRTIDTEFPLPGRFQLLNALCALALAVGCGADPESAVAALPSLKSVPGRLEVAARLPNGATAIVDFAHTPDALRTVLKALRPFVGGRLIVLFGCGGDRDAGKRSVMGEIAARFADHVIVTDDNPRSEDAAAIRQQVLAGCPAAQEVGDRAEAIGGAIAGLEAGDMLVVAGKGHETGQIVGQTVLPFSDFEAVRDAARRRGGATP